MTDTMLNSLPLNCHELIKNAVEELCRQEHSEKYKFVLNMITAGSVARGGVKCEAFENFLTSILIRGGIYGEEFEDDEVKALYRDTHKCVCCSKIQFINCQPYYTNRGDDEQGCFLFWDRLCDSCVGGSRGRGCSLVKPLVGHDRLFYPIDQGIWEPWEPCFSDLDALGVEESGWY